MKKEEEIPLIINDPEALAALKILQAKGYNSEEIQIAFETLPTTKVAQRRAKKLTLDTRIKKDK